MTFSSPLNNRKRIGILGGTFDPVHYGHLRPALEVKSQLNLDEVWLMPNHIPPHKQGTHATTKDRLTMLTLACEEFDDMKLCDIEINRETPSFTATTLKLLKQCHPNYQFYFIMGMDSLISLPKWHQWQQLFSLCHFAICQRPGWQLSAADMALPHIRQRLRDTKVSTPRELLSPSTGFIYLLSITPQAISSTQIRNQINQETPCQLLAPKAVLDYIKQNKLYR